MKSPVNNIWYYVCRDVPDEYHKRVLRENYPVGDDDEVDEAVGEANAEWHRLSMQWNPIMITKTLSSKETHEHYFDDWVYMHIPTQRPFVFHYIEPHEYDILDAFDIPQLGEFNVTYTFSTFWVPGGWKLTKEGIAAISQQNVNIARH